jgi:hypothetical protein
MFTAACTGDSQPAASPSPQPTSPSSPGPVNVAGTWSGTLTFNGTTSEGSVTLTLAQPAGTATVNGSWMGKNNWSGTITGSISGNTFAGQLVWNYIGGGASTAGCIATATLSGNAGGNAITWTSSSITRDAKGSVFCDLGVTSLRIDATKQ